jgi:hypothetical protein
METYVSNEYVHDNSEAPVVAPASKRCEYGPLAVQWKEEEEEGEEEVVAIRLHLTVQADKRGIALVLRVHVEGQPTCLHLGLMPPASDIT